jgi:hypothetical protein
VTHGFKEQGMDGRVKHGHDGVGGWIIGHERWYEAKDLVLTIGLGAREGGRICSVVRLKT